MKPLTSSDFSFASDAAVESVPAGSCAIKEKHSIESNKQSANGRGIPM